MPNRTSTWQPNSMLRPVVKVHMVNKQGGYEGDAQWDVVDQTATMNQLTCCTIHNIKQHMEITIEIHPTKSLHNAKYVKNGREANIPKY